MQTATNPQTGEKLVLQNGQWVPMGGGAPSAPGVMTVGTPRPKQPSPQTPAQARADELTVTDKSQDIEFAREDQRGQSIDRETGIRKEFSTRPEVKDFASVLPIYSDALRVADTKAGDLNLIYSFGKIMDPGSVVREGEMVMVQGTGAVQDRLKALMAEFDSTGRLNPRLRKELQNELRNKTSSMADAYNQQRQHYIDMAKQYGIPELNIVGPHPAAPHQQAEADFLGRPIRNLDGSQGAAPQGDEQVTAELERRIASGADPSETIQWLISVGRQPDKATIDAIIANYGNKRPDVRPPEEEASPLVNSFMNGVGDVVEGVGDIPGILANPMTAGINWATGSNFNPDLGQNLRDSLGLPDNGNPMASAVNEAASSALGGAGLARTIANGARGVTQSVANTVAEQPIRQGFAGAGAGAGGEFGREQGLGPAGQAGLALLGGTGGYVAANSAFRAANPAMNPVMEAATAQNVRLRPADVGGATTRRMDSAAGQSAFSASSISNAAKNTQDDLNSALNRNARSQGNVLHEDEAGEALRTPLKDYSQKQANRIGLVYDRAEERAKGVKIKPLQAVNFLDQQIARFREAPMGETLVKEFQAVRDKIANGVSVSGMRDARTILSQGVYDGKLRSGVEKGVYKQFLGLLSQDIEAGLTAAGRKDALNLFKVADKAWSERIDYIDDVLQPVIGGNKSGEDILKAVEGMTQGKAGGVRRLNELLRELPPEQSGNIRATIIDRMGRATAGQQDDTGQAFSANTFLTNWNRMSSKGKAMMFGDGELRKNLDQIAKVASATKETGRFANSSNTSGSLQNNVIAMGSASGVAELATGHGMATLAALTSAQLLTGKLLSSQAFTRWLARFPANPQAQPSYSKQLAQIAAREPIIANDIASVQNFLGGQSYRAAASSEDQ